MFRVYDTIDVMRSLGVYTHASKCLFGDSGDFLLGLYTQYEKITCPMRSLRGIFYAHPWIERRQYQGIVDISQNWQQVASRLQMWRCNPYGHMLGMVMRLACSDIARWGCGLRASQIMRLFHTPTSLGGLGCIDLDVGGEYHLYEPITSKTEYGRGFSDMFDFVGIKPDGGYRVKTVVAHYIDMTSVTSAMRQLAWVDTTAVPTTAGLNRVLHHRKDVHSKRKEAEDVQRHRGQ
ncbi:hypothetical protein MRX96_006122 [Rhipicephalus microplus]